MIYGRPEITIRNQTRNPKNDEIKAEQSPHTLLPSTYNDMAHPSSKPPPTNRTPFHNILNLIRHRSDYLFRDSHLKTNGQQNQRPTSSRRYAASDIFFTKIQNYPTVLATPTSARRHDSIKEFRCTEKLPQRPLGALHKFEDTVQQRCSAHPQISTRTSRKPPYEVSTTRRMSNGGTCCCTDFVLQKCCATLAVEATSARTSHFPKKP